MSEPSITALGDELFAAWRERRTVEPLSARHGGLDIATAYRVQERFIEQRRHAGESVVGKKIGVTSRAVMQMLNVHQPDFGYLMSGMAFADGEALDRSALIQPRAEGEVAFVLKDELRGPGVTAADVLRATEGVMACFEIVDSRITDWKITITDTIADNASCGVFVLGSRLVDPRRVDLSTCGMVLEKNGEVVATGAGAAALGSPVNAVAWLANTLGRLGTSLRAGEVILSGSLAALIPVSAGDCLALSINGVGTCTTRFT